MSLGISRNHSKVNPAVPRAVDAAALPRKKPKKQINLSLNVSFANNISFLVRVAKNHTSYYNKETVS